MVAVGTRIYHMQSSLTAIVIRLASRCIHLKLYMAKSVEPLCIGIRLVKGSSLGLKLFKRKKNMITQTQQKSYADNRRRPLEFEEGDHVYLKVSTNSWNEEV
jgi:hypothetical protein